jgi:hypothetical protein
LSPRTSRIVAAACLAAALSVGFRTWQSAQRIEDVTAAIRPPPLSESPETAARRGEIAGTYATGDRDGDRLLIVDPAGAIRFSERGVRAAAGDSDRYQLAREGRAFRLVTDRSGVVEVLNIDTVRYSGDTYERTR